MGKRKTTSQFIAEAKAVHGDKYDYSKVEYKRWDAKIIIICPVHGEFWQFPNDHLKGCGCPQCPSKRKIGVCDMTNVCFDNSYIAWKDMLGRCYLYKEHPKNKSYYKCFVCEDWLVFSNFYKWFYNPINSYKKGYNLDKDILVKGNQEYSPPKCCFVPQEINKLLIKTKNKKRELPIGVSKTSSGKFQANFRYNSRCLYLGSFKTKEEAFYAYKNAKELYIKEIAETYFKEGKITKKVYDALMNYEVEITD